MPQRNATPAPAPTSLPPRLLSRLYKVSGAVHECCCMNTVTAASCRACMAECYCAIAALIDGWFTQSTGGLQFQNSQRRSFLLRPRACGGREREREGSPAADVLNRTVGFPRSSATLWCQQEPLWVCADPPGRCRRILTNRSFGSSRSPGISPGTPPHTTPAHPPPPPAAAAIIWREICGGCLWGLDFPVPSAITPTTPPPQVRVNPPG